MNVLVLTKYISILAFCIFFQLVRAQGHIDIAGDGSILKLLIKNGTGTTPSFGSEVDSKYRSIVKAN